MTSQAPQSTGARREGGSGRSDLERDAISRQVQVDLIRGAIRDAKKVVDSKKGTGIPTDYECGVVSGLVMALQFMGELTADGALQVKGLAYLTLHTTNAGGVA